jgi:phospholipid-binding lipoprotein MlaA
MSMDSVVSTRRALAAGVVLALLGGCAHNPNSPDPKDPYEETNRKAYGFNDSLDRNVLVPLAEGWQAVTPTGFRQGMTNAFNNFTYLNTILNDILQGKLLQALQDSGRVVLNTTLGIGGFFDVATPFGFEAHQEDFGQTLATWGFDEGDYLVFPFLGPTTQRDAPGFGVAAVTNPLFWIGGLVTIPIGFADLINTRANLLEATRVRDEAALDPYTFTREAYRQRRNFLINDGQGGDDDLYFDLDDDLGGQAAYSTPASAVAPQSGEASPATPAATGEDVLKID